jgi:hypothetical protein
VTKRRGSSFGRRAHRRRASLILLAVLTLTSISLIGPATAAGANPFGPGMFGISTGGTIQDQSARKIGRDLDLIREAGARWVRIDINWAQIQAGGPTSYDWGPIDRVVRAATARELKVLGLIVYTPEWARAPGADASYGPDPATYAAFANQAVEHYAAMGVHHYEIWNEPNIARFWQPSPDPVAYTHLLKAAYLAIKQADPRATVLTAGTAPSYTDGTNYSPVDFLRGIYDNGGGGFFDAVAHHPYTLPAFPGEAHSWSGWYQMYGTSPSLRSVMTGNGDGGKQIWATEFGAPTNGPSGSYVSADTQAKMIQRAYSLWRDYEWGGPLFTYQHRDFGTSATSPENFYGLVRNDYSKKPSFRAYRRQATLAGVEPDLNRRLPGRPDVRRPRSR